MTFVSSTDLRQRDQQAVAYDPLLDGEAGFQETFAASVGHVIDEGLSISSQLNIEAYKQRQAAAQQLVDEGEDLRGFQDEGGAFNFDLMAQRYPQIATDRQLYDLRNTELARRRAYSDDVKARGSGFAQFAGEMTGYMLDPVNIATLPIGASASALRGLGTLARIRRVAVTELAIGATAETLIQPFVYAHKNEIGSPYSLDDSLQAIGTAALGGAVLGGAAAGIAGFLRSAAGIADKHPGHLGAQGAKDSLNRIADDLQLNPERGDITTSIGKNARAAFQMTNEELSLEIVALKRAENLDVEGQIRLEAAEAVFESRKGKWSKKVQQDIEAAILEEQATLTGDVSVKLSRGDRKALRAEIADLKGRRDLIEASAPEIIKAKGVPARKAKADALKKAEAEAQAERALLTEKIDAAEARLEASRPGEEAEASLSRLEQGIYSPELQARLKAIEHRRMVEVDTEYLRKLETTRRTLSETRAIPLAFDVPEQPVYRAPEEFEDADLAAFDALGIDGILRVGDENVSAREFIDNLTDELAGLDSVRVCALG